MPFIDIKVIQGVFTPEEKRELVERLSEAAIAVEGEALRPFTVTAIITLWRGLKNPDCSFCCTTEFFPSVNFN